MKSGQFELLPVDKVELDTRNPRISRFLDIHEGDKTEAQITLALNVTGTNTQAGMRDATTPAKLRASIVANGGIRQPIIVNKTKDGRVVCIEGNTILWIYRSRGMSNGRDPDATNRAARQIREWKNLGQTPSFGT